VDIKKINRKCVSSARIDLPAGPAQPKNASRSVSTAALRQRSPWI